MSSKSPELPPLVVRADGSAEIGIGHLMRGLALIEGWRDRGGRALLVGEVPTGDMTERFRRAGASVVPLDVPPGSEADLEATIATLEGVSGGCAPWLFLDGYRFDEAYHSRLQERGCRFLAMDDHAHLQRYQANVLLNQNLHGLNIPYHAPPETVLLLGPRFALIREEFVRARGASRAPSRKARNLLVTLGGGDPWGGIPKILKGLTRLDDDELHVRVIVGPVNRNLDTLRRSFSHTSFKLEFCVDPSDMARQIEWADLLISSAGSTAWEAAAIGRPQLLATMTDNQHEVGESLHQAGAGSLICEHSELSPRRVEEAVREVYQDTARMEEMAVRGRSLVDGRGVERVISTLECLDRGRKDDDCRTIRPVEWRDRTPIWHLANDPMVRANAFNNEPIPYDSHLRWLRDRLFSPRTKMWLCEIGHALAGQVRYDTEEDHAVVTFSVAAPFRGRGLGTYLLAVSAASACESLGVSTALGRVKKENVPSRRAFSSAGWSYRDETSGVVTFEYTYADGVV